MSDLDAKIDEAGAALREETAAPISELEAARTRARILATHRRERARAPRAMTWLAAAAALMIVLGGSTAWAYWSGRLDGWIGATERPSEVPAPVTVQTPGETPADPPQPQPVAPPVTDVVIAPAPVVAPVVTETPAVDVDRAASPIATEDEVTPARTPVDPRERAAYRTAHTLHFEQHDAAGAIDAWDTYLAEYPRGRFVLEARYNRALCLVRLGRTSEAREALAPFVAGTHGGYRQHEATELVQALDAP